MLIPKSILLGVAGLLPAIVSGNLESGQQITFMPSPSSPSISEKPHPNLKISNTNRNGVDFERITMDEFPEYAIRVRSPEGLCDPTVRQYSGYLDISETKHLFFWFFESRDRPESDPVVLWLNGGPGCSSSTGLLFELGPCNVRDQGKSTEPNPHGWNKQANVLFLDQPVNVGYSYAEGSSDSVSDSITAAKDVHAFLQLFYARFPAYLKSGFHVAAESYGGQYAPNIATRIIKENNDLQSGSQLTPTDKVVIPLSTVIIGNGLTDPLVQFASVPDYACAPSPYAIFDESTCASIRSKVPTCERLQKFCYSNPSRFTCVPATLYCWSSIYGPIQNANKNPYDVRQGCDRQVNPLCYDEMNWIENYLNRDDIRTELGVPSDLKFESCNLDVNRAFQMSGDNMHNSASLIPDILSNGVRLLIYAGEDDFMCNYLGNERWMMALKTEFSDEFQHKAHKYLSRYSLEGGNSTVVKDAPGHVGMVRSAGPGAGNFTFVSLYESGHMVPHDQPEIASELINKWLQNQPLH
ncbi:hypothetical protein PGT21_011218 [Puccinia graminis f. sp. tritici]|uniref:Carboxypeptidase n=2 Tax=Puccinia graminis f. sp. tritici TaxID=56615 RepID=E3JWB1_PUCGT|nr:carboxypeptidase C [Puccinia graminis f. sp. tritici CRL 75-36-700-3]EFP76336.2 carboxypeptidase C [Puccinia graminis f. sp. tritici CRL 75-36-700-3]KAA1079486.1 hypothetical protein PGT21_012880 [Puccinia graminis f. sp. tritici]KAA1082701.1 hypothetical protein PGT21_011218 [Puccinia graminis f. sp. tritici]KAA1088090.1 hypothetical protein PGTUg99_028582 [Puccinia graminis f. sp. tritici]